MEGITETKLLPHPETGELIPEVWVPVIGYEQLYQISNYSRIISLHGPRPKVLKQNRSSCGYYSIELSNNSKTQYKRVHVIAYYSFFRSEKQEKPFVIDHKDNNKLNNFLPNLQRITNRDNVAKNSTRKYNQPRGVYKAKDRWVAQVVYQGKTVYLGGGKTQEDAHQKYIEGTKRLGIVLKNE